MCVRCGLNKGEVTCICGDFLCKDCMRDECVESDGEHHAVIACLS